MGHSAVELAIDEVRHPTEKQPERRDHAQPITEAGPSDFLLTGVKPGENHQPENAAVAGHAAFPNAENKQRILR